jgi:hypothetical protein
MPLPRYEWEFSALPVGRATFLPSIFREWHRAKKLGGEISVLKVESEILDPERLERLNLWLYADGAWRASLLPHFEAERVLLTVLRHGGCTFLGGAGGGRWPRVVCGRAESLPSK